MDYFKRLVCLANSRKHHGRYIAGKEVLKAGYGPWIRPVGAHPSAELSEEECRYETGQDPRILDIIDVPIIAGAPLLHQTENYIIDGEYYWIKRGELPWGELRRLVDEPDTLWFNGDSTHYGLNDRVKLETAGKTTGSLLLIQPATLSIHVHTEGTGSGNPRRAVRASFMHRGVNYRLIVTDPVAERTFLGKSDGQYSLDEAYLCVSLEEAQTDDYCHKLVATVIMKELVSG